MDFGNNSVKYSEIKQDALLADLYSKIYTIPKSERVKVLMSWLANAYSDLLIPFLPEADVLETFTVHVRLVDTFSNNSSYDIVAQLAEEFSENFLKHQVIPNLLENNDKIPDRTYYIQIICENLTCPTLIRKLMSDVVTKKLTPILIVRITSENSSVAASTLSLIKTLLEFYCEDFWYDLVLQYLLPMKHLLTSQRQKLLPEIQFQESTHKILQLIPSHVQKSTSPSLLAEHFLLYYQDEIMRLRVIDAAVSSSLPSSKSDLQKVGLGISNEDFFDESMNKNRHSGKNVTYPMWIFRYDGTDFLHALRKGFVCEEPEEFFEDDLFSSANQLEQFTVSTPTLFVPEEEDNGFVHESEEGEHQLGSPSLLSDDENQENEGPISISDVTLEFNKPFVKDKRKSLVELDGAGNHSAYFGPFLQTLFEILQQWCKMDPAVLFSATEVVSVLASSRIPLITTLFLDLSLTLQPSYPSFSILIHTVKNELDENMKAFPDYIFRRVWKSAAKDCSLMEFYSTGGGDDEDEDGNSGFVSKLKRSLSTNKPLRMMAEEVQRTIGGKKKSSSFRAFTDIFKNSENSSEFRLLNRTAAPFENEEEERSAKDMALRSVLFSHWMLELGAIAMQLSWGRIPLHGKSNREYSDAAVAITNNHADEDDDFSIRNSNSE